MSGGGSSNDGRTDASSQFSSDDLAAFASSSDNQWSKDDLMKLSTAQQYKNDYYVGNTQEKLTPMATAFQAWKAAQTNTTNSWAQYATLADQNPGRDQNILTGPQVSPNLLGLGRSS